MRHPRLIPSVAVASLAAVALLTLAGQGGGDTPERTGPAATLEESTISAGPVEVRIVPLQIDAGGAVFHVSLDTHSVELDLDVVSAATLRVGGTEWPASGWAGDGPGGHHREGELTFEADSPPSGPITLTVDGLPGPVEATWAP